MTNFNWYVDGSIIVIYLIGTIAAGLYVRKYVKNVSDFLVADRSVDLYLGIASLAATEFGIATCMANAELGYNYGFAGITPGVALMLAMFIVGKTGFCIKPLRMRQVITLPEFFQDKFGTKVRWASGVVIVLGGLLNMGVFLRQAGDFLVVVCDFNPINLEWVMTIILIGVALYTILGGMLSVLITDYIQFIMLSLGLLLVIFIIVIQFGWINILDAVDTNIGSVGFNPFSEGKYGWDRIVLDLLIAFSAVLTWQTIISRALAAKSYKVSQKIYTATSPFLMVRFLIPAILGIAAIYYFGNERFSESSILAMPNLIAAVIPIGLIGFLVAAMLAADMSTNSSYMLAWSSVIYNDILKPIHKNLWSDKKGLIWNRILIAVIGIFLLLYGLWYPLKGDLWVYLQVTGTIYLSSMSVLLIAACYWDKANNWGAIAAIITGSVIPVTFLILQQLESTQETINAIGPVKFSIATFLLTAVAMYVGSTLKSLKK